MMVDDVLRKVDLMSMANGIECRSPLLDYRILEFAARLSLDEKIDKAGRSKALLRYVLARYVPPELFSRPKMGFCIPWAHRRESCDVETLIRRWRVADFPHFRTDAGAWIFQEEGEGAMFRKWNAFTQLVFFENYRSWCSGQYEASSLTA
jgi:asparagine synthase (glutamine-hydrolysing)